MENSLSSSDPFSATPTRQIVYPKGHWFWGHLRERNEDAIGFFSRCFDQYGDAFHLRFGPTIKVYVLSNPVFAKAVLNDHPENFTREVKVIDELAKILGRGLLTSHGEKWRRQRRLMQPAFHQKSLQGFFDLMVKNTETLMTQWDTKLNSSGPTDLDLSDEFMKLTLRIVSESLFGFDTETHKDEIAKIVDWVLPATFKRVGTPSFLRRLPTKKNRQFSTYMHRINSIIESIIDARRKAGSDRSDLLGMLMAAVDETDNSKMNNTELHGEIMTMFVAGHETTANGLAWTLHELADHPEVEERMRDEINRVVGDGPLRMEHLRDLQYIRMVFEESLRLHPPIWAIPRMTKKRIVIDGLELPAGVVATTSIYLMHRNPKYFPDPLRFDPERFNPERRKLIDRYAYIPFGAGAHTCIGNQFALMEAQIILTLLYRRYSFTRIDQTPIKPVATLTMRPQPGIKRRVRRAL